MIVYPGPYNVDEANQYMTSTSFMRVIGGGVPTHREPPRDEPIDMGLIISGIIGSFIGGLITGIVAILIIL